MRTPAWVYAILMSGPAYIVFSILFERFVGFGTLTDSSKLAIVIVYVILIMSIMLMGPVTLYMHRERRSKLETGIVFFILLANVALFFWWISVFLSQSGWMATFH